MATLASFFQLEPETLRDPYPYYELLREQGPIVQEPHEGVFMVTSYDDILEISNREEDFSARVAATGPWVKDVVPKRPDVPFGEADISAELDAAVKEHPMLDIPPVLTMDPPLHGDYRILINRLFRPARLQDMIPRLAEMAEELVDEFADAGEVDFFEAFASPYPFLAISELFGIPREDQARIREQFRRHRMDGIDPSSAEELAKAAEGVKQSLLGDGDPYGGDGGGDGPAGAQRLADELLFDYLEARRREPMDDVLTQIATATFPNGELPDLEDLKRVAGVVYGAGQETTVRLLTNAMLILTRDQDLQRQLAADPELVPSFVDEVLRFESPVKGLFRIARRDAEVNGVQIPAGSIIMLMYGAANRDSQRFQDPDAFDVHRPNARQGIAFGHGNHFCPGSPLARTEGILAFRAIVSRIRDIRLHPTRNEFRWVPWHVLRGLEGLHITFARTVP